MTIEKLLAKYEALRVETITRLEKLDELNTKNVLKNQSNESYVITKHAIEKERMQCFNLLEKLQK